MTRTRLIAMVALVTSCVLGRPARAGDQDEDGIDDALEQLLLDMYRPILRYDSAQITRPCTAEMFVRNSRLLWRLVNEHEPAVFVDFEVFTQSQLDDPNNPNSPLLVLSAEGGDFPPSNTIDAPQQSTYRIDVADAFRHGPPGPIQPIGMYGHVVPLRGPLEYTNATMPTPPLHYSNFYLIQYWQMFPSNISYQPGSIGDHEGDWVGLDLLVERVCPYTLRYMVHHHHGDDHCGATVTSNPADLPPASRPFPLQCDSANLVRVPVCFLEVDVQEWWPWASGGGGGECSFFGYDNRSHDGLGVVVESQNVMNLGERYAPMPGLEPQLVMFYNGVWGHDHGFPNGPSVGPLFAYPPNYPHAPLDVAHVDTAAPAWSDEGHGSRYHPFSALADALAEQTGVQTGGRVLIAPHNFAGPHTFSRQMRFERDGVSGTVVIGQ